MRGLSKVLTAAVAGLAASGKSHKQGNRRNKSRPSRINVGQGSRAWGRALPASYASHVKPGFRIINRGSVSTRVAGCDLVYSLPAAIASKTGSEEFLFSVIPANPAYWTGTRIAQMAPAYMNYRPISLTFHYIPQVAVTQPGSVIYGTLWNGAAPSGDLQQTLNTSNGGGIINCYVPSTTRIALGNNLQQNLFTLNGDINPDTSPFVFVAVARGCTNTDGTAQVVPGYWMVDYVYDFKNPIGQTWIYDRTLATQFPISTWSLPNRSVILLEQITGYGPGTVFDCEQDLDGDISYYYRGSPVTIPVGTWVQAFENGQGSSSQQLLARIRELEQTTGPLPFNISSIVDGSDNHISFAYTNVTQVPAKVWFIFRDGNDYVIKGGGPSQYVTNGPYWLSQIISTTISVRTDNGLLFKIDRDENGVIKLRLPNSIFSFPAGDF